MYNDHYTYNLRFNYVSSCCCICDNLHCNVHLSIFQVVQTYPLS